FDIFETWWEHHKDDWVATSKLHGAVQQLLLHGRKFSRQLINYEVRELVDTRIANFLLQEKSQASKWSAAEFRLVKTDSPRAREGFYDQQGEAPVTPEAAAPAAATSDPAESDDADGWQFNREPESGEDAAAPASKETAAPAAPPDAFNAEGRLAV